MRVVDSPEVVYIDKHSVHSISVCLLYVISVNFCNIFPATFLYIYFFIEIAIFYTEVPYVLFVVLQYIFFKYTRYKIFYICYFIPHAMQLTVYIE